MRRIKKLFGMMMLILVLGISGNVILESNVTEVQAALPKIGTPKLISAKTHGSSKIKVTWKRVGNITGYSIYRKTNDSKWKRIKTISNNRTVSYIDSKVMTGTKYTYSVRAYRRIGKKNVYGKYDKKGLYVIAGLETPRVTKVYYAKTTGMVDVSWKKISGAQYYEVYCKRGNDMPWELVEKSNTTKASLCTTIGEEWFYTVRACIKISNKVYKSNYDKRGKGFIYEEYGNPYIDYSVFDIIVPSKNEVTLNTNEIENIDVESKLDDIVLINEDDTVAEVNLDILGEKTYSVSICSLSEGVTVAKLYSEGNPKIFTKITINVQGNGVIVEPNEPDTPNTPDTEEDRLVMAAIGIQEAYTSAKFPSTLHIRNITYNPSIINGHGDNISRLVVWSYAQNSFGGYRDIFSVVIRSKTNRFYPEAFEYDGYYYITSSYNHEPGLESIVIDNGSAVDMWKYLYDKNFDIPYI